MLFSEPPIPLFVQRAFDVSIRDATLVGGGFSGAAVFRATTDDGRELAVRRTPESIALPLPRLSTLHHLLREMSRRGCNIIAVPLFATNATTGPVDHELVHHEFLIPNNQTLLPGDLSCDF